MFWLAVLRRASACGHVPLFCIKSDGVLSQSKKTLSFLATGALWYTAVRN